MTPNLPALAGCGALARFAELASLCPEAPFVTVDQKSLTRRAFLEEVSRVAGALSHHGICEGDTVLLCCPNQLEWCIAFWGCVALGAQPAPLDPATGIWELRQLLPVLNPRLAIATAAFRGGNPAQRIHEAQPTLPIVNLDGPSEAMLDWAEFLERAAPIAIDGHTVRPDECLLYACTSGTTGAPKILAVPHLGFVKSQEDMAALLGLGSEDRMLLGMPLYHQGGFGMGLQALLSGAQAHYVQSFDPMAFLEHIEQKGITVAQLSPTLGKLLLTVPGISSRRMPHWRIAYFAGEVLPDGIAAQFWCDYSLRVVNVVGSSETGTMLVWDSTSDTEFPVSDLAVPSFTKVRVLDEAERPVPNGEPGVLWVHTDALLARYHGNPKLTAESLCTVDSLRWYCTGDIVLQLPNHRYRFVGRLKRVVKRGPNLVHPEEVESFLLSHPSIAAVAVTKEPHPIFGESLIAWVQPRAGVSLTRAEIVAFCQHQISSYKIPDRFHFLEQLPADLGKVQHRCLRELRDPS